jgi:hypothetical protein
MTERGASFSRREPTGTPPSDAPRVFRCGVAVRVVMAVAALVVAALAVVSYLVSGWTWVAVGLGLMTPVMLAGVLDSMTARLELRPDSVVIVHNLVRREYPKHRFVKIDSGKGVPISLQMDTGEWVALPGVGTSRQGMVNTLRAWLRR